MPTVRMRMEMRSSRVMSRGSGAWENVVVCSWVEYTLNGLDWILGRGVVGGRELDEEATQCATKLLGQRETYACVRNNTPIVLSALPKIAILGAGTGRGGRSEVTRCCLGDQDLPWLCWLQLGVGGRCVKIQVARCCELVDF